MKIKIFVFICFAVRTTENIGTEMNDIKQGCGGNEYKTVLLF